MKKVLYVPTKLLWGSLCVGVCLLLIGSFTDLQLSNALYSDGTLFEMIGYCYGPLPLFWCFDLFACSCIESGLRRKNWSRALWIALGGGIIVFGLYYIISHSVPYYSWQWLNALIGTISSLTVPLAVYKRQRAANSFETVFKRSLFAALCALSCYLIVHFLKMLFLRPRYRLLLEQDSLAFQPWYKTLGQEIINGVAKDEFYSFPSGHSATSTTILIFSLFYKKPEQTRIYLFGLAWILFTTLSRIVAGAHFLSDVSGGFVVTILVILIGSKIFNLLQKPETL